MYACGPIRSNRMLRLLFYSAYIRRASRVEGDFGLRSTVACRSIGRTPMGVVGERWENRLFASFGLLRRTLGRGTVGRGLRRGQVGID